MMNNEWYKFRYLFVGKYRINAEKYGLVRKNRQK